MIAGTTLRVIMTAIRRMILVLPCALVISCAFGDEDAVGSLFKTDETPLFLAVGGDGANKIILASPNGWAWSNNILGSGGGAFSLNAAAYGFGRFVVVAPYDPAIGTFSQYVSDEGLLWLRGNLDQHMSINDIIYRNGLFVAVGLDMYPPAEAGIWVSIDGFLWARAPGPPINNTLEGIAYGNGRFVAVGGDLITVSPDGFAWSPNMRPSSSFILWDVAYGAGLFVAVGEAGNVSVSADGLAWSDPFMVHASCDGMPCHLNGVDYDSGMFVAVGSQTGAAIFASKDGLAWSSNLFPSGGSTPTNVAACNGTFIAVTAATSISIQTTGFSGNLEASGGAS